jgi:hypothetical protein
MLDYDKFYDDYCVADCNEKAKLLEQLKVVLFFGYDDVYAFDDAVKLDFLTEFFTRLEHILNCYRRGEVSFARYFSQAFTAEFEVFGKSC